MDFKSLGLYVTKAYVMVQRLRGKRLPLLEGLLHLVGLVLVLSHILK